MKIADTPVSVVELLYARIYSNHTHYLHNSLHTQENQYKTRLEENKLMRND